MAEVKRIAADFLFIVGVSAAPTSSGWARAIFVVVALYGVRVIARQEARRG